MSWGGSHSTQSTITDIKAAPNLTTRTPFLKPARKMPKTSLVQGKPLCESTEDQKE